MGDSFLKEGKYKSEYVTWRYWQLKIWDEVVEIRAT